jgi:hypothetical protein
VNKNDAITNAPRNPSDTAKNRIGHEDTVAAGVWTRVTNDSALSKKYPSSGELGYGGASPAALNPTA